MKRKLADLLNRNVIAEVTVMKAAQVCLFIAAIVVFAFGCWELPRLGLTAPQLLVGVVWTTVSPLVIVCIGLLLPMLARREDEPN
jgi:hypothetical protein